MTETRFKEKSAGDAPPGGEKGYRLPLTLQRLYVEEQKTGREIAAMYNVDSSTIYRWLDKHGIESRGGEHREPEDALRYEMTVDNYMAWSQSESENRDRHFMFVHRLLAVAEYGVEAVAGNHVHHKNGIRWDNRPENLEVLSPSEHQKRHLEKKLPSDEELLEDLRMGYEALGHVPTTKDVEALGEYSETAYRTRFGSVVDALIEAGIRPRDSQIQNDRIAEKVERVFGAKSDGDGGNTPGEPTIEPLTYSDENSPDWANCDRVETADETEVSGEGHRTHGLAAELENADPDEVSR